MRRRMFLPSVLAILSGALACEHDAKVEAASADILSGSPSDMAQVVVFGTTTDSLGCSGTLIAPDVVLTAAHCVMGIVAQESVYVGYSKVGAPGSVLGYDGGDYKRYRIVDRAIASELDITTCPGKGLDVALVRLEAPADVPPAVVADGPPTLGEECVVVGYGRHAPDAGLELIEGANFDWTTGERRQARIRIVGQAPDDVAPAWFSAQGVDGAHSSGDSGGPLLCGGKIAGVVSCTVNQVQPVRDLVKIYANVHLAKAFIDETLRRWHPER